MDDRDRRRVPQSPRWCFNRNQSQSQPVPCASRCMARMPQPSPEHAMSKWIRRALVALLAIAVLLAAIAAWLLRGSLPVLGGQRTLPALAAPVSIQRDALGVVTIEAASQADALRALGYVHAQERYFEMDLMRRNAAGELAALFGPAALPVDRAQRIHRMRARSDAGLDALPHAHRAHLQAYVDGVNAGLRALRVRPWPYLLLRQAPQPWQASDSM